MDPVERFLRDLAQIRGELATDMIRAAPGPLKDALHDIDQAAGKFERDIERVDARRREFETTIRSTNLPGIGTLTEVSTRLPGGGRITGIFG